MIFRFPIIDNDILSNNLEDLIRQGPLKNVDILIGVTADEALYFAEEHIFNYYAPKQHRTNPPLTTTTTRPTTVSSLDGMQRRSLESDPPRGFSYFRKTNYIKNYLKINYPDYLCYYEDIRTRYIPNRDQQQNLTETARLYTNLVRSERDQSVN